MNQRLSSKRIGNDHWKQRLTRCMCILLFLVLGMVIEAKSGITVSAAQAPEAVMIEMEDGEYAINVTLEGGSGRVTVLSPTILVVKDARAYAQLEWSSPNYDYMLVGGEKYLPINEDGNSKFEIPITVMNQPMEVVGDTTAMSVAHEINYTLIFDGESITDKSATPQEAAKRMLYVVAGIVLVCMLVSYKQKRRRLGKKGFFVLS